MNGRVRGKIREEARRVSKQVKGELKTVEENIINIPNFFTLLRVIITFIIIYTIFFDFDLGFIAILFVIGMITDAVDGNVARIFNMKTEFGRKFDMIADRFLFIGTIISILVYYSIHGLLSSSQLAQIMLIMMRELIAFPAAVWAYFSGNATPQVRAIGKVTTVMQAISFPVIILGWNSAWVLAIATGIVGIFSGTAYLKDVHKKK